MTSKAKTKSAISRTSAVVEPGKTKMQIAADKAIATGKMANTLAKALARRVKGRWKFTDFTSDEKKRESAGVVDMLAIRKCSDAPTIAGLKKLDLFDIIVIQVKGGSALWPTNEDIGRLRKVADHYHALRVVLFQWVKEKSSGFYVLDDKGKWVKTTEAALFLGRSVPRKNRKVSKAKTELSERDIALWENDVSNLMGDPKFAAKVKLGTFQYRERQGLSPQKAYPHPDDGAKRKKYATWLANQGKAITDTDS